MDSKQQSFVYFGGDYNPDQWDAETIEKDIAYFKEAGINLVTLPVFSWAKIEPKEGEYHFEWLDRILERLWQEGIRVCLATPTTAQPAWLSKQYPEVLPVDIAGRKRTHGMRVFFCVNSEKYRERARALAKEMGRRYQHYEGLAAWHVSNEYGTYCYCENCQKKFRIWLKNRYQTVDHLNEKWNSAFWGRTVYEFDEVMLPTECNDDYRFYPAVQLDYMRFVTDSTAECFQNEAAVLKKYTPDIPVFSNISGFIKKLNQYKLTEQMDLAGWDNYPGPRDDVSLPALKHDIMRSLKGGKSYWVVEQSPNQQNWQPYNKLKRPGELKTIAYQGLAHGADTCLYFQMRQSVGGQEKFHGSVISHADTDQTRIYQEIRQLGREFQQLGDAFTGGQTVAKVGILFDWESWWALELCSGPSKDMDYLAEVHRYYKAFYQLNIPIDLIKITEDLSSYSIVIAPLLYMEKDGIAERVTNYVKGGGTFLATYMTGVADANDRCLYGAYPGKYRNVLGLWVEETDALYPEEHNEILVAENMCGIAEQQERKSYTCSFICERIHTIKAQVLGVYGSDFYQGEPCFTVNHWGEGRAYYLATRPSGEFLAQLANKLCADSQITAELETESGVELATRVKDKNQITFVINHKEMKKTIHTKNRSYVDLLTERQICGEYQLAPREVLVLKREL